MADINNYANDLLLDFIDSVHVELARELNGHFGQNWLDLGVRTHFKADQFTRVEKMLQSPMRVVDMNKIDEEIYGIEHLWNIIEGNWAPLFQRLFQDKLRTQVYLGEITELRHNLAHRRSHHYLLKTNLVRVVGSCRLILSAMHSLRADFFAEVEEALSAGVTPWGRILEGQLPPSDEIYREFVGRPGELDGLSDWLASENPQILVWGYGGVGKSALAYKFARDIRDGSDQHLIAVCWVSAKRSEYSEGLVRDRPADFSDLNSFIHALWTTLYGPHDIPANLDASRMLSELREMPVLLVVDDFDTISENLPLTEFLMHDLRNTPTRVIYTSRHRTHGLRHLEVPPFSDKELEAFVMQRSVDYKVEESDCLKRLTAIASVTGGYPLFVDDLIRHAGFIGVDEAISQWSQRKGDAARQYALQRQIQHLGHSTGEVLIALSVANRALRIVEISGIAGLTDDDTEAGIHELLQWRMVNSVKEDDSESPVFRMNHNTSRLVQQTFRDDGRTRTFSAAFRALTGERVPEAKKAAIAKVVRQTKQLAIEDSFESAKDRLLNSMTGELADSADLFGVLGWLYSSQDPVEQWAAPAQEAFEKSHRLGSYRVDTYYHWAQLERKLAESMITRADEMNISESVIANQWKQAEDVAEKGITRCGPSRPLCYLAGYSASREAKSRNRANSFYYAEGAYARAIEWFSKALNAPLSDVVTIGEGMIYKGITLAYEGLGQAEQVSRTLKLWHASSGSDAYFQMEFQRLLQKFPLLREVPQFRHVLAQIQY